MGRIADPVHEAQRHIGEHPFTQMVLDDDTLLGNALGLGHQSIGRLGMVQDVDEQRHVEMSISPGDAGTVKCGHGDIGPRAQQVETDIIALGALKALACTVYRLVAEEAIQLHGGIGLTMEHPCHLFLKRAMLNGALGGDADHWDEQTGRAALAAAAV